MIRRILRVVLLTTCFVATIWDATASEIDADPSYVAAKARRTREKLGAAPRMGLNLAGVCDWNTELPFVDVFHETREWISQRRDAGWGRGPELELDERGWVKRLEKDCWAEVPLCTIEGGHYPSGVYTIEYEGKGKIEIGGGEIVSDEPGRILTKIDSSRGAFWLRVLETDPDDYARNIRVYLPNYGTEESRRETGIWNPAFLERWKSMKVFRTMDWQRTNGSPLKEWQDRPLPEDAIYSRVGLPLETICDFINRTDADLWFCVPDQASDDFVRRCAELLKRELRPNKKLYLEYSNEVWNFSFAQARRAAEKGKALQFAETDWEASWRFVARRSVEIFRIFEETFGDDERLIRVLPSQAANPYVSEQILAFEDAWRSADALAIAPYVGWSVSAEEANEARALGVDGVLDRLENEILPETIEMMKKQGELARRCGLALVCYEAGQHLVGLWGANDSEELNDVLTSANRSERMGAIYNRYYDAWEEIGGSTLCHFSSVGKWTKWGSWGLIEYADETPDDSPKYKATLERARRWNER